MNALLNNLGEIERLRAAPDFDPNAEDEFGTTALIYAAHGGHADAVKALLAAGADRHRKNAFGTNALQAAQARGHAAVARLLQ